MRVLVLGGSVFVGRAIAEAAIAVGHDVTVLNRGRSGDQPRGADVVLADRDSRGSLEQLGRRTFDLVVDTARQSVGQVRRAVDALDGRVGGYIFTSTASVYTDLAADAVAEDASVAPPLLDPTREQEADPALYPALNTACEQVALERLGDRCMVLRLGLVAGTYDRSDRFGYWSARIAHGGDVLVGGALERRVQYIDAVDVAAFALTTPAVSLNGVYNVTGPPGGVPMADLLRACPGADHARLVPVDDAFLLEREVTPYTDLPLWLPDEPDLRGFHRLDTTRAVAAGLSPRPVAETAVAALAWERVLGVGRTRSAGLTSGRESALLQQWQEAGRS